MNEKSHVPSVTMKDQAQLIRALLFQDAKLLQETTTVVDLEDGEVLFHRGDPGDAFYVIEAGYIRIFTLDEEGKELTLNTLGPAEAFGELALLDGLPRSASVSAIGPVTLRRLRRVDFLRMVRTSPSLADTIVQLLSQRVRNLIDYVERLGHWSRLVAAGQYDRAMESIQATTDDSDRVLGAVADAVESMVRVVQQREQQLRQEVAQLRIQIDETKQKQQVAEITGTTYFQELAQRAQSMRDRSKRIGRTTSDQSDSGDSES